MMLREREYVARLPVWVYVLILGITACTNLTAHLVYDRFATTRWAAELRTAASAFTTALVIYAAGWGSILGIGFMVGATEIHRVVPRRGMWRSNVMWTTLSIVVGQIAVQVGWAPSIIDPERGHFIAFVTVLCLVLALRVLGKAGEAARAAEEELRSRSEHFEALVRHATDVIGVLSPDGIIESVSPAIADLLGHSPGALEGTLMRDILHPDEIERARDLVARLPERAERSLTVEVRLLHADGSTRLTVATITAPDDWEGRMILNLHDITTQRGLEELLRHQATHDHLTGLWNRAAFHELVSTSCARSARHGSTMGVLFVDLDGFKQVNDSQGHDVGDGVLREAAERIQAALRQTELLARLGGDECAVHAEPVDGEDQLIEIATRLLDALGQPWDGIGDANLSASIGIASHTGAGAHPEMMLRLADAAMYQAKRRGGRQWQCACPTIRSEHGEVTEVRLPSA
jgi:diguanylate cyclase (GGDEF)-like protein/PAS domain S-box-containing protein